MSSDEEGGGDDGIEVRHRKEKKELRAKTLAMRKAAKSGNKQKQKETNAECDKMEKELEERQKAEVAEIEASKSAEPSQGAKPGESVSEACSGSQAEAEEKEPKSDEDESSLFYKEKKISNKAAKRQAKKKEADEKWKNAVKDDKEASKTSDRFFELEIITKILADKNFAMVEIEPDGDCMYNAIAHQLSQNGVETTGKKLRKACSKYMRQNKDDFVAFIEEETSDSEADWEKYLMEVERIAECGGVWGGELELSALSRHLKRVIEVYKTDGDRRYGEEFDSDAQAPIRIVYLRKVFHLGEHYNSIKPLPPSS